MQINIYLSIIRYRWVKCFIVPYPSLVYCAFCRLTGTSGGISPTKNSTRLAMRYWWDKTCTFFRRLLLSNCMTMSCGYKQNLWNKKRQVVNEYSEAWEARTPTASFSLWVNFKWTAYKRVCFATCTYALELLNVSFVKSSRPYCDFRKKFKS